MLVQASMGLADGLGGGGFPPQSANQTGISTVAP